MQAVSLNMGHWGESYLGEAWQELENLQELPVLWELLVKQCVLKLAFLVDPEVDGSAQEPAAAETTSAHPVRLENPI